MLIRFVQVNLGLRPCEPCDGVLNWRQQRSAGRNPRLRTRMLQIMLVSGAKLADHGDTYAFPQYGYTCESAESLGV